MGKDRFVFERIFASKAHAHILDFVIRHPDDLFFRGKIKNQTKVAYSTTIRVLNKFEKLGILRRTEKDSVRLRIYALNSDSELVKTLTRFLKELQTLIIEE